MFADISANRCILRLPKYKKYRLCLPVSGVVGNNVRLPLLADRYTGRAVPHMHSERSAHLLWNIINL